MCGIGGFLDPAGALDRPRTLAALGAALAHRGPDGEGVFERGAFGLAHRRLAIIDLTESGAQPMKVGPIVLVYNGEIYNYRELREELKREGEVFTGLSDSEVLARAYLQWGARCVDRLRGMWAFAIADLRSNTLLCSRDPFGVKPFYYAWHRGAFLFASEPQALIRAGFPARANLRAAAEYLALGLSDHDEHCFFEGITQLGAGATLEVSAEAKIRTLGTWSLAEASTVSTTTLADFDASLTQSVRLHLRSDVPVGTCLSGGLDSSTVAALAAAAVREEGAQRFTAITAASGDPRTDERQYAEQVAKHCDLAWHVVKPEAEQFAGEVNACLLAQGEPVGGPSVYFQYRVMAAARAAGVKVMLDGQGADELLGGYERYVPAWGLDMVRKGRPCSALHGVLRLARNARPGLSGMSALATYVLFPAVRRRVIAARSAFLRSEFVGYALDAAWRISRESRRLHSAQLADLAHFSLPALLRFEDRNSMAHSIEARVPYVDRELATCALRLPESELMHKGFTKYPLRAIAARVLPASIAWRRFKVGFEPPTARWLAGISERMQREVESSSLIACLARRVPSMRETPLPLQWRLFNLARWQQLFAVGVD